MAPTPKQINVKIMGTDRLVSLAEKVGAELNARVGQLAVGQRALGIEGLRIAASGYQRALIQYPGSYKKYEYSVPDTAQVGDLIKNESTGSFGEIVELATQGYSGEIKTIDRIYKAG